MDKLKFFFLLTFLRLTFAYKKKRTEDNDSLFFSDQMSSIYHSEELDSQIDDDSGYHDSSYEEIKNEKVFDQSLLKEQKHNQKEDEVKSDKRLDLDEKFLQSEIEVEDNKKEVDNLQTETHSVINNNASQFDKTEQKLKIEENFDQANKEEIENHKKETIENNLEIEKKDQHNLGRDIMLKKNQKKLDTKPEDDALTSKKLTGDILSQKEKILKDLDNQYDYLNNEEILKSKEYLENLSKNTKENLNSKFDIKDYTQTEKNKQNDGLSIDKKSLFHKKHNHDKYEFDSKHNKNYFDKLLNKSNSKVHKQANRNYKKILQKLKMNNSQLFKETMNARKHHDNDQNKNFFNWNINKKKEDEIEKNINSGTKNEKKDIFSKKVKRTRGRGL